MAALPADLRPARAAPSRHVRLTARESTRPSRARFLSARAGPAQRLEAARLPFALRHQQAGAAALLERRGEALPMELGEFLAKLPQLRVQQRLRRRREHAEE